MTADVSDMITAAAAAHAAAAHGETHGHAALAARSIVPMAAIAAAAGAPTTGGRAAGTGTRVHPGTSGRRGIAAGSGSSGLCRHPNAGGRGPASRWASGKRPAAVECFTSMMARALTARCRGGLHLRVPYSSCCLRPALLQQCSAARRGTWRVTAHMHRPAEVAVGPATRQAARTAAGVGPAAVAHASFGLLLCHAEQGLAAYQPSGATFTTCHPSCAMIAGALRHLSACVCAVWRGGAHCARLPQPRGGRSRPRRQVWQAAL